MISDYKRKTEIYHHIKQSYMSDYNLVFSSKSRMADLVILGIDKDIFVKIIYSDNTINIDEMIEKVKNKSIWRGLLRSKYIFYIYDENYSLSKKLEIDL